MFTKHSFSRLCSLFKVIMYIDFNQEFLVKRLLPKDKSVKISILHLSDLHRDLHDELDNEALLESLAVDARQFPTQIPPISTPDICVVSGDLVYGVPKDYADYDKEINRQYSQTEEFLVRLADSRFNGDRSRIVIIPGNHDVAFPVVMQSTEFVETPVKAEEKRALVSKLFQPHSPVRWSWEDLCFYQICDQGIYAKRLEHFAAFYSRFYQGSRTFSLDPGAQFDVFDFPDLNLSVAALNSCHENDPLNRAGNINSKALAQVTRALTESDRVGRILVATWHHSLSGPPNQNDYMNANLIQHLIDAGISVGLHGHQHSAECLDERYKMGPKSRKMTIISAGTLCSGPKHLKTGHARGYNVVELDSNLARGLVHQRKMANDIFDAPIWGPGQFNLTGRSFVEFDLSPPLIAPSADNAEEKALREAEEKIGQKLWKEAVEALKSVKNSPLARIFILKALQEINDNDLVMGTLWPPEKADEIVLVGGAILETKDKDKAADFVQLSAVSGSTDSSVIDIVDRIKKRVLK